MSSTKFDSGYPKDMNNPSYENSEDEPQHVIPPQQPAEVSLYKVPTVMVDLPSKGLVYPKSHPLHSGQIEIKYMTAKEEDILATESFIRNGTVIERFLQSLVITPGVNTNDMIIGDIDALTVAARVYGYGHDYEVNVETPSGNPQKVIVDLSALELTELQEELVKTKGVNEFEFKTPTGKLITFKLLTQKDQQAIQNETRRQAKSTIQGVSTAASTQLKHQIVALDGIRDRRIINDFVDNYMLATDARALRKYIESIQPGIDLSVEVADSATGEPFLAPIAIGVRFFWPDARLSD